ncbi:MAG: glycosyltransferase family 4 protein [Deltaproteobacteria bacterium]|nr:glycosyltransferase family 4 protein [Deltaproteobacteria bacterium]
MTILYFYQHFVLPEKNGITRTYEFARRLASYGHQVHLIVSDESLSQIKHAPYETHREGITIHWIPIPYHNKMPFFKRIIAFFKYVLGSFKVANKLAGDLIYVSTPPLTSTLSAVILSKLKRIPVVLEVRDLWPELPIAFGALRDPFSIFLARRLEKIAYRNSHHVVALSPGIQRAVVCRGVKVKNTSLIPNSCDIEFFKEQSAPRMLLPKEIGETDPIVLYPGTIGVANGVDYIVKIAQAMLSLAPPIKFVILGDGKEKEGMINLAKLLGVLNHNLFFLEPIPKSEISSLYQRSSLILNTLVNKRPLWNSSPNKFFDALAVSKPVAINFKGWLAELIEENEIGLVLDPNDIQSSARQISQALSHPLWIEKAGRKAFQIGKLHFDRDTLAIKLNAIFESIAGADSSLQATFKKVSR